MSSSGSHQESREADFILHPKWLVPMTEKGLVLSDHSLAIQGNKIVAIEPCESLKNTFKSVREINLENHLLIPGLINAWPQPNDPVQGFC